MKTQLLTAKWVLPITELAQKDAGVVIEDNKIVAVGSKEKLLSKYPKARHRDFGTAIIMPGMVDLHTHLEYAGLRGVCDDLPFAAWKIQLTKKCNRLDADDWFTFARLGAIETVQSGITTIADTSSSGASLMAAYERGLRGVVYYELLGMDHSLVDNIIDKGKADVAAWAGKTANSLIRIGIAPYSPYTTSPPLIRAAAEWAKSEGLKVCIHIAGSPEEYNFVKYGSSMLAGSYRDLMGWGNLLWQPTGVTPVKYILQHGLFENDVLAIHCVQVNQNDMDTLAEHDVAVAHCPRCSAKLAMGIAPLRKFLDIGLRVGLGTDSPASNNTMDFFDEMRIGLLFQRGLNQSTQMAEAEIFVRMATFGGAQALGLDESIGSLEPGKQADIVAVDMSHSHQRPLTDPYSALVYTANQENVVLTMVGGKIVYDGNSSDEDETDEILRDVVPIRKKLR